MSGSTNKIPDGDRGDCHHCYCIKKNKKGDEYSTCQNHLKNWQTWIERRKKIYEKLSKSVGRPHDELLINANEDYRSVQEDKLVFQYTNINTDFDKLRGNPEFWKLPVGLIDRCDRYRDPTYFTVKTKQDKNEIPVIEYVGSPNYILKEKNVLPRTRNIYQLWKNCKYRNQQLQKLSAKIAQIEPHKPQYQSLVLVGQKIPSHETTEKTRVMPKQTRRSTMSSPIAFSPVPKVCFIINGIKLTNSEELVNDFVKVRLIFEAYRNLHDPVVQYLKLENMGLTTLRFYWRRIEKFRLFRDLIKPERKEYYPFYFDKSELLLPPGKIIQFPVWFKASDVGNYSECWEISTVPTFWGPDYHLIISLQGFVFIEGFDEMTRCLKAKLEENVRNTLIADLLNNICSTVYTNKYTKTPKVLWRFTEEQLFESANQENWGVEKRSKYLYNAAVVNELKQFYKSIKRHTDPTEWNYSVKELKIMTRKKDILDYVEQKTNEAIKARERRIELQKILKEQAEISLAQKQPQASAKNKPDPQEKKKDVDPFQIKETHYNQLEHIVRQLERPLMIKNNEREKYFTAFIIMRTYMFKMCDALESISNESNFSYDNYYPSYNYQKVNSLDQLPQRLLFENFDDIWVERIKQIPPDGKVAFPVLPKPEILKDIPLEDTKTRYKRYFNLPDTPPESKGKGKGKDKKGDKDKKTKDKKDKKSDSKPKKGEAKTKVPPRVITVIEGFNPYAEEYVPPIIETSSQDIRSVNQDYTTKNNSYDYEKYLIVYNHLYEAIGAIVDALETFKENIIPVDMLGGLTVCTNIAIKEDHALEKSVQELVPEAPRTAEDALYYRYLLNSHLKKNLSTKRYIIHGQTKPDEESKSSDEESQEPESLVNLFRSHITLKEEVPEEGTETAIVQTSDIDEEYKTFSNILFEEPIPEMETTSSSTASVDVDETYTREIFYYLGGGIDYNKESEEMQSDSQ